MDKSQTFAQGEYPSPPAKTPSKRSHKKKNKQSTPSRMTKAQLRQFANKRVIQRNLVYVMHLSPNLANEEVIFKQLLIQQGYFGQYGNIIKCKVKHHKPKSDQGEENYCAHITFSTESEASLAIKAADSFVLDSQRTLTVTFGTTKYCSYFLKQGTCPKEECPFLHFFGSEDDTLQKEVVTSQRVIIPEKSPYHDIIGRIIPPDYIDTFLPSIFQVNQRYRSAQLNRENYRIPKKSASIEMDRIRFKSRWEFATERGEQAIDMENYQELVAKPLLDKIELSAGVIKKILEPNPWMQDFLKVMSNDQCITANDLKNGCIAEDKILVVVPTAGMGQLGNIGHKMAEEEIRQQFQGLVQEVALGNHDKILAQVRQSKLYTVQNQLPQDQDLVYSELVSLINLSRFEEAEQIARQNGLEFELAYSMFKQSRFEECLAICNGKKEQKFQTLQAQASFRLGVFDQALGLYEELIKKNPDNLELQINLSAATISPQLAHLSQSHKSLQSANDWEILFNKSCAATEMKNYPQALALLQQATERLKNDENYEDEKIFILLQRGYIYQCMQNNSEAVQLYNQVLDLKTNDESLHIVALNNILAANETNDNFKRLRNSLLHLDKLTPLQKAGVLLNMALFYQKRRKMQEFERALAEAENLNILPERVNRVKAYSLFKQKQHDKYKEFLLSQNNAESKLLLAKLLLLRKDYNGAAELIMQMDQSSTEITLQIASVFDKSGMSEKALQILETAYQQNKSDKNIVLEYGTILSKNQQQEQALKVFQDFLQQQEDPEVIAQLIYSSSTHNKELAQQWSAKLPGIDLKQLYTSANQYQSLDEIIDDLEFANISWKPRTEDRKVVEQLPQKRKRTKKPRYPKGFDPENPKNPPPDPERWLPKHQRSTQKKRKKQQTKGGAQGGTAISGEIGSFNIGPKSGHSEAVKSRRNKRRR